MKITLIFKQVNDTMMIPQMILLSMLVLVPLSGVVFGQQYIVVNQTTPCFLNYTASYQMFQNCNADADWLKFALLPFEWVTGGYFSLILATVFVLMTYLKYHKAIYPIVIGCVFVPSAIYLYPETWIGMSLVLVFVVVGIMIYKAMTKQTSGF